jgi:hypothetical protein
MPPLVLLGTLSSSKDADPVLLLLSPSECFEQGKVMLDKPLFPLLIRGRNDEGMALNAFEPAWLNHVDKEVCLKLLAELGHEVRPDSEAKMLVQDEFITFELDHKLRTKAMVLERQLCFGFGLEGFQDICGQRLEHLG